MQNQPKRRRTEKKEQIPERVGNAAQQIASNPSAFGPRRGYVPETGFRNGQYASQNTGSMPAQQTRNQTLYAQGQTTQNGQIPYYVPYAAHPGAGQTSMNGGQRGFRIEQQNKPPRKKRWGKILAAVISLILVAGLCAGGYFYWEDYSRKKAVTDAVEPYNDRFCQNVYVDGIHLGGMTADEAITAVQSRILQRNDSWKITITYQGQTLAEIDAELLNLNSSVDTDVYEVMNQAWLQGHNSDDPEQRYAEMVRLLEEPYYAWTAKPQGNTQALDEKLAEIKRMIDTPAADAQMTGFDTSLPYPFVFTDEAYGASLDTTKLKEELYSMVSSLTSGTIELQPERLEPTVRKADLMKHYMLRSSVYTPIAHNSPEERNMNIQHAFDFIDGYVLEPGKSFSFNGVVGERTTQRDFYQAVEYAYGEHTLGVGGGVCQASTTLYQAAVCAGLQIVKREPHSDSVSYTDYGKDATVFWVGKRKIDLVFKNNTESNIYIVASVQPDPDNKKRKIAKVSIYGEDMGDVWYEIVSEITEVLDPPTEPKYIRDNEGTYVTYTDQQKTVSKAKEGYVVNSYRLEYTANVLTGRKWLATDRYEPQPEKIYVGVQSRD